MRCELAHPFTIAKARAWRSAIDIDPPYQRPSGAWTLPGQQRLIDSVLNGYDIPKLYLHDLRGQHPTVVYAVIDGKQRLTAIWSFLEDGFPLADDFALEPGNVPDLARDAPRPLAGQRWSDLDPAWQRVLQGTSLSVVLVRDASPAGIAELFVRLNAGVPLTPAELHNATGRIVAPAQRPRPCPAGPVRIA